MFFPVVKERVKFSKLFQRHEEEDIPRPQPTECGDKPLPEGRNPFVSDCTPNSVHNSCVYLHLQLREIITKRAANPCLNFTLLFENNNSKFHRPKQF